MWLAANEISSPSNPFTTLVIKTNTFDQILSWINSNLSNWEISPTLLLWAKFPWGLQSSFPQACTGLCAQSLFLHVCRWQNYMLKNVSLKSYLDYLSQIFTRTKQIQFPANQCGYSHSNHFKWNCYWPVRKEYLCTSTLACNANSGWGPKSLVIHTAWRLAITLPLTTTECISFLAGKGQHWGKWVHLWTLPLQAEWPQLPRLQIWAQLPREMWTWTLGPKLGLLTALCSQPPVHTRNPSN